MEAANGALGITKDWAVYLMINVSYDFTPLHSNDALVKSRRPRFRSENFVKGLSGATHVRRLLATPAASGQHSLSWPIDKIYSYCSAQSQFFRMGSVPIFWTKLKWRAIHHCRSYLSRIMNVWRYFWNILYTLLESVPTSQERKWDDSAYILKNY